MINTSFYLICLKTLIIFYKKISLLINENVHFSNYKEEHPEEKLEDGQIMNKVIKIEKKQ